MNIAGRRGQPVWATNERWPPYRYVDPVTGELIGVHEAARRAAGMLLDEGRVIEASVLEAEYQGALTARGILRDDAGEVHYALADSDLRVVNPATAAGPDIAASSLSIAARLQVYMHRFAPAFRRVHPDNVALHRPAPDRR